VRGDRRQDASGQAHERGDIGRSRVLATPQTPQQRRTQKENEDRCDGSGDDDLQPHGCAEQVCSEAGDATDAEHQEREVEREHLDHEEDQDQDQPPDPRELFDRLDELHGVPPVASNLAGRVDA